MVFVVDVISVVKSKHETQLRIGSRLLITSRRKESQVAVTIGVWLALT